MNPHAGWTNTGICVLCGSWNSGAPCDSSQEALWEKINLLYSTLLDDRLKIYGLLDALDDVEAAEIKKVQEIIKNFVTTIKEIE